VETTVAGSARSLHLRGQVRMVAVDVIESDEVVVDTIETEEVPEV